MKKKILITMTYMHIGGGERSLLGLLHSFDYSKYDVDLFIFSHEGDFMNQIPKEVNLLPENEKYKTLCQSLKELKSSKRFFWYVLKYIAVLTAIIRFKISKIKSHEYGITQYVESFIVPFLPKIKDNKYDIALSFMNYHSIIKEKVNAKIRCGWFHTDFSVVRGFLKKSSKNWDKMDYIVNVSEEANNTFIKYHPNLRHKCIVIENILSDKFVRSQAEESISDLNYSPNDIKILTIGRYSYPKAYDRAIRVYIQLKKKYNNIKWYIIGCGEEQNMITNMIKENNLENDFIDLGKKINPYPYYKMCDIYAQPSNYEGKSVTVREAQMIGKPIVITNYTTAPSQIDNGIDGIICEMSDEGVVEAISKLIENKELRETLSKNCLNTNYGNENEIEKIYSLIK